MSASSSSPLAAIEPRLRTLLPADLYASTWVEPSPVNFMRVFEHLRTLHRLLQDYVPRHVSEDPPAPGRVRHAWEEGTLMFTDLAGFTAVMEANAALGPAGAESLLSVLNDYFATMIEIIGHSGGILLEFTGDALLAQFQRDQRQSDTTQAVRAGLRMQRAMRKFAQIQTPSGTLSLGMRVGIHTGRFFTADIGTPRRMEHVLLGDAVQRTKHTEGAGRVGRVCLTETTRDRVKDQFRFESGNAGYVLLVDDLTDEELGEYDIGTPRRKLASGVLMDRSLHGLVSEIEAEVRLVEPLSSYLPSPILNLLVENAARRKIPPDFVNPTVVFVNLIGLPESVDGALQEEEDRIVASFSSAFALINAAVEARGGVLKKVTYHLAGSDIVIYFGVPNAHTDDPSRAANAALAIRDIVLSLKPPTVGGQPVVVSTQIGISRGRAFAAEIGEPRGRREFNVAGDTVNIAARLMNRATGNRILMTQSVAEALGSKFNVEALEPIALKGKTGMMPVFALHGLRD